MADERLHERADALERPAAVAGRAPAVALRARADGGLVLVLVRTRPPRIHHVVGGDLVWLDRILGRMPLGGDVRCECGEGGLRERAGRACIVAQHRHWRALEAVAVRASPPHRARVRRVERGERDPGVPLGVPQRCEPWTQLAQVGVRVRALAARGATLVVLHRARRALERVPVRAAPHRRTEAARVDLVRGLRILRRVPQRRELRIISDGFSHASPPSCLSGRA